MRRSSNLDCSAYAAASAATTPRSPAPSWAPAWAADASFTTVGGGGAATAAAAAAAVAQASWTAGSTGGGGGAYGPQVSGVSMSVHNAYATFGSVAGAAAAGGGGGGGAGGGGGGQAVKSRGGGVLSDVTAKVGVVGGGEFREVWEERIKVSRLCVTGISNTIFAGP